MREPHAVVPSVLAGVQYNALQHSAAKRVQTCMAQEEHLPTYKFAGSAGMSAHLGQG